MLELLVSKQRQWLYNDRYYTCLLRYFKNILKLIGSHSGNIHSGCIGEWSLSVVHCMDVLKIMYVCVCVSYRYMSILGTSKL